MADYFADIGPQDHAARLNEIRFEISVYAEASCAGTPVGTARGSGYIRDDQGDSIELFLLSVGKGDASGRFVLDRRQFVPLAEWGHSSG